MRLLSVAGLMLMVLGCASSQGRAGHGAASSVGDHQRVMVFLPPWPESALQPVIAQLALEFGLSPVASWKLESLDELCVVFELNDHRGDPRLLSQQIALAPRVRAASAVETFVTLEEPYRNLQHGHESLGIGQAHDHASGRGVRVAVVDTGVDFDHPDLRGRVVEARNFVGNERSEGFTLDRHGTAVAGVIAAARNGEGVLGIAPEAELIALKACHYEAGAGVATCRSDALAIALDQALALRAQVINLSLAGPEDPGLGRILAAVLHRGVVVVAADDINAPARPFPASWPGVLAVAGGTMVRPTLSAPSVDVLTTVPVGRYDFVSGSSMAAAAASGVIALLLELAPEATPAEIIGVLEQSARSSPTEGRFIDAAAAVLAVAQSPRSVGPLGRPGP